VGTGSNVYSYDAGFVAQMGNEDSMHSEECTAVTECTLEPVPTVHFGTCPHCVLSQMHTGTCPYCASAVTECTQEPVPTVISTISYQFVLTLFDFMVVTGTCPQ
jgi:hypothetical protein